MSHLRLVPRPREYQTRSPGEVSSMRLYVTTIPVHDLRSLATGVSPSVLGTEEDPRFALLDAVAAERAAIPSAAMANPSPSNGYALVPVERTMVDRMNRGTVPVSGKKSEARVFAQTWPGVITAFDELLKAADAQTLKQRMFRYLGICAAERRNELHLRRRVEAFARELSMDDRSTERAVVVAIAAANTGITYDDSKVKLSVSGSIPNDRRWYPPPEYRHFIYYEPAIQIPRNENPGRDKGWGNMNQWRERESHEIAPKLVFTSSSNPKYGYKAFVVDSGWYVKIHGGKSQQYNYTGLSVSRAQITTATNLWADGARLADAFVRHGRDASAVLHYVSAIYNSALAEQWMNGESAQGLRVKLPAESAMPSAVRIADLGRDMRDLHRLLYDGPQTGSVERGTIDALATTSVIQRLGLTWQTHGSRRFRQVEAADLPSDWIDRIRTAIHDDQASVDSEVDRLYD